MNLRDEIAELQIFYSQTPRDEAATRERIIYPLLRAAGYSTRDIQSEQNDNFNKRPDYTLLPEEPAATWFLEAKAWRVELDDEQVFQALNYANHNGKRWVVLSNGRSWRLYDNDVRGLPALKLAATADLEDQGQIEALLVALGPESIRSERVDAYASEQREARIVRAVKSQVAEALARASRQPDHPVVAAIVSELSGSIPNVTPEIVSEGLRHMGGAPIPPLPAPVFPAVSPRTEEYPTKSWTPYQAAMRLYIETMVRNTPGLNVEQVWKRGVGFMPVSWANSVGSQGEWARMVLFWFDIDNESQCLLLKLIIGPGPAEERDRLFRIAQATSAMHVRKNNPSQKWDTIYRKRFQVGTHGKSDLATVQAGLQAEWDQFVRTELPALEDAFR